jgi:hypothetical protein
VAAPGQRLDAAGNLRRGCDGQRRTVDPAEFASDRDGHAPASAAGRGFQQRVARKTAFRPTGRRSSEPGRPRLNLAVASCRVDADADISGIVRVQMIKQHLAAEGAADRQIESFGERRNCRRTASSHPSACRREWRTAARLLASRSSSAFELAGPGRLSTGCVGFAETASTFWSAYLQAGSDHRAGAAGCCDRKGTGDEFRNASGHRRSRHPFGNFVKNRRYSIS